MKRTSINIAIHPRTREPAETPADCLDLALKLHSIGDAAKRIADRKPIARTEAAMK